MKDLTKHPCYQPRKKQIKMCNGKCTLNPETLEADSYGYWLFTTMVKGKLIFNKYHYSNTTSKHQWRVRGILDQAGLDVYLEVEVGRGLQHSNINEALDNFYFKMFKLEAQLANPRTKAKENILAQIKSTKEDIKKAKAIGLKVTRSLKEIEKSAKDDYAFELQRQKEKRERKKAEARAKLPAPTQLLLKIKDFNNGVRSDEQKIIDAINEVADAVKQAA